jgi:hypothetical protein
MVVCNPWAIEQDFALLVLNDSNYLWRLVSIQAACRYDQAFIVHEAIIS